MSRCFANPIVVRFAWLVACGLLLAAPYYYLHGPKQIEVDALAWVTIILITAGVLRVLAPAFARTGLLALVSVWLIAGVGLANILVVILWLLSAWSIGALLLRCAQYGKSVSISLSVEAVLLGGAFWLALWGGMLHFSINYRSFYLGLCALPLLFLLAIPGRVLKTVLVARVQVFSSWMGSIPLWAWSLGLAVIGWVLRWASFPSLAYDDHVLHLRLWTDLLIERQAVFGVKDQVWSVAPFATDLLHAGLSLMAGTDARSALNLSLAVMLLGLVARTLHRLNFSVRVQWLLVVLLASTPMLGNLLLSLQAELLLALVGLAGFCLVIDADDGLRGRHVLGVLACAALCVAIKLPGAVLALSLLFALILRRYIAPGALTPSNPLRWPALLVLLLLVFVAVHSYVVAWWITGNPVFPLFNAIFRSPLFEIYNFSHSQWIHGFSPGSYLRAFFQTSEFFESGNYVAGWQYLLLLPIALLLLFRRNISPILRLALLPLLGFGLAMFAATQYWRYLFPVMPIAGVLFAVLFVGNYRWFRMFVFYLTLLCIVLNLAFFPRVSWMMQSSAQTAYTDAGQQQLVRRYAPVVWLTSEVNRIAPGSRVLYPREVPSGATLHGRPLYVSWYAPSRAARFASLKDSQGMTKFLAEEEIDFVILSLRDDPVLRTPGALLREHVARQGVALTQESSFILYSLAETPRHYRRVFDLRNTLDRSGDGSGLLPPVSEASVMATLTPQMLTVLPVHQAKQARYSVRFRCSSEKGFFIAQINWDVGPPYYRLVSCQTEEQTFVEAMPVPFGAHLGHLYITVRDTDLAQVMNIQVDVD